MVFYGVLRAICIQSEKSFDKYVEIQEKVINLISQYRFDGAEKNRLAYTYFIYKLEALLNFVCKLNASTLKLTKKIN